MVESANKVILPALKSNDLVCEIFKFYPTLQAYLTVRSLSKFANFKSEKLNSFLPPLQPKERVLKESSL